MRDSGCLRRRSDGGCRFDVEAKLGGGGRDHTSQALIEHFGLSDLRPHMIQVQSPLQGLV